jgi:hypothetical protein
VTSEQRLAALSALCGTAVLAAFVAGVLLDLSSRRTEKAEAPIAGSQAISASVEAPIERIGQATPESAGAIDAPQATATAEDAVSVTDVAIVDPLAAPLPLPPHETPAVQTASVSTPDPVQGDTKEVSTVDASSDPPAVPRPEPLAVQTAAASTPDPVQGDAIEAATVEVLSDPPALPQPEPAAVQIASTDAPDPVEGDEKAASLVVAAPDATVAQPEAPALQVASLSTADPTESSAKETVRAVEIPEDCLGIQICIDDYLFSVYQRTPKQDTTKLKERSKITVKKNGKTRTVVKTIVRLVAADFTWKDPKAAERVGMSLKDYVIGGMDRSFRLKLYRALRALDEAGLVPGITSGFRDNYRQEIASGQKAASDSSYHGGSRRGGYGHGMAADLTSVRGETRDERFRSSELLWKWIDEHGAEYGVGRPYLDRDPPHVGPIDGKEYVEKRGRANARRLASVKHHHRSAARNDRSKTKRTTTVSAKSRSS